MTNRPIHKIPQTVEQLVYNRVRNVNNRNNRRNGSNENSSFYSSLQERVFYNRPSPN
jgi:hypothetical protein